MRVFDVHSVVSSRYVRARGLAYVDRSVRTYVREISIVQGLRRIIHHPNYDPDTRSRSPSARN